MAHADFSTKLFSRAATSSQKAELPPLRNIIQSVPQRRFE